MTEISPVAQSEARRALVEAMRHHGEGRLESAEHYYLQVLERQYRVTDILPLLAGIAGTTGRQDLALRYWNDLLDIQPDHLVALLEKGGLLLRSGEVDGAIACFEAARSLSPQHPLALNNLAVALVQAERHREALQTFRTLSRLQPDNVLAAHQIRRLTARIVPFWHIPMLNDVTRNDAFEAAIRAAITQRDRDALILDIGSGSGLLAMMAARAGAANVISCEAVPVIAEAASAIVAVNGYEDQVKIVNKMSTDLVIGDDLPTRADILVSEILSSDLLAEDVLSTFEDAHARLLNEGAMVIPRAASAVGCLVESDVLSKYAFVGPVSGFDVSAFAPLAALRLPVHGTMTAWNRLSPDIELQRIDLTKTRHAEELRVIEIPVSASGRAIGIVQWMRIDLAEGVEFSNHPDDYADGGWLQVLHPFPAPVSVEAGSILSIIAGHDRNSLILMPLPMTSK